MRLVLDAEATACGGGFADKKNNLCAGNAQDASDLDGGPGVGAPAGTGRDPFLAVFCDRYVRWLAAPFRRGQLAPTAGPARRRGARPPPVGPVAPCCVRSFFALEVVSFCARAFVRCTKFFLLRTRLLSAVLEVLGRGAPLGPPTDWASGRATVSLKAWGWTRDRIGGTLVRG